MAIVHKTKIFNMRKKIPIMGRIAALSVLMFAPDLQATNPSVIFETKDGSKKAYLLEDNPVITFNSEGLEVELKTDRYSYAFDEIVLLEFGESTSAIINIDSDNATIKRVSNDEFEMTTNGTITLSDIRLYTLDGREFTPVITSVGDTWKISIADLNSGLYMLKIKDRTFKIIKK